MKNNKLFSVKVAIFIFLAFLSAQVLNLNNIQFETSEPKNNYSKFILLKTSASHLFLPTHISLLK